MQNVINEIKEFILIIKNNEEIHKFTEHAYAHKHSHEGSDYIEYESLKDHMDRTIDTLQSLFEIHNYNLIFNIYNKGIKFDNHNDKMYVIKTFILSVYLHDMGKTNPLFQIDKMKNLSFDINNSVKPEVFKYIKDSNHSLYNFFSDFVSIIPNTLSVKNNEYEMDIVDFFQYELIAKHHSSLLISYDKTEEKIIENTDIVIKPVLYVALRNLKDHIFNDFMFVAEILFDLLITSDILATKYFYVKDNFSDIKEFVKSNYNILDSNKITDFEEKLSYNKYLYSLNENISLNENSTLNEVKLFTAYNVLNALQHNENNISLLKLPTGIGKTNLSYIYINEMLKKDNMIKKIVFVNPLNNLNYQVADTAVQAFNMPESYIQILNNETKYDHMNTEEENYLNEFNFKTFNYPFIITSHVSFFEKIFGKKKDHIMTYTNLNQSIIIFDEIQLYNDQYLGVIYRYFLLMEKYLDTKILIISATVPLPEHYESFIGEKSLLDQNTEKLIYNHKSLKRFSFNLDFFDKDNPIEEILDLEIKKGSKKILIVHNNIKKLNELKKQLKDFIEINNVETYDYQNTILPLILNNTLNNIRNSKSLLIVFATTKIETGIDISFDTGIRFAAPIDTIFQFGGRVNRYGDLDNSTVYLLKFSFSDFLIARTKEQKNSISMLHGSDISMYETYLKDLDLFYKKVYTEENNNNLRNKEALVKESNFLEVSKFKLIENTINQSFFVNMPIDQIPDKNIKTFLLELNINETKELINLLKENINNINKYSKLIKVFNLFTFSAYIYYEFKKELSFLNELEISIPKYNFKEKKFFESPCKIAFFEIDLNSENFFYSLENGLNQLDSKEFKNKLLDSDFGLQLY